MGQAARGEPAELNCRASHTGDAIRVVYSSVSVHVLGACAQVQSTV